jgi:hypothetical protein
LPPAGHSLDRLLEFHLLHEAIEHLQSALDDDHDHEQIAAALVRIASVSAC